SMVRQLSSIEANTPVPSVRSIFKSFLNPQAVPLILTTIDVRSPKTAQLIANPQVHVA
ncbi:hypothetical protein BDP27DRAFT_1231073, partial [Rhodocollybia butyracea]